jgi:outer membrane protein TolC
MIGRVVAWALALVVAVSGLCACDFGKYEQGYPVSREVLRTVEAARLAELSAEPPATLPATVPATLPASRPVEEVRLTIAEVRRDALANNLELRVELFNPTIAREAINEERARFESTFFTDLRYESVDPPSTTGDDRQTQRYSVDPGVNIPLRTGGFVRLNVPTFRVDDPGGKEWNSDFTAALRQPLLRGAGLAVNSIGIRTATYQYQSAEARTKLQVIAVLADADRIYWRLYASRRALEVRKKEYDLAQRQLDRARRQAGAGAAGQVEVVRAESGVADAFEGIINAEQLVLDNQRDLKRILNRPDLPLTSPTQIVPVSDPAVVHYRLDPQRIIAVAMDKRMELLETELQIASDAASIELARNEMLPLVTLDYTYNVSGMGRTAPDSFTMIREGRFMDHRLGLSVEVPIGNEAARSRLRRALVSRMQSIATKDQRAQLIEREVMAALDQLETNWQRILAARRRVAAQSRVLEAEERQFAQGLRTSTEVLDAVTRLASAALSEITAVTEYQIAQVDIAVAGGMLLGAADVRWSPVPTPAPNRAAGRDVK